MAKNIMRPIDPSKIKVKAVNDCWVVLDITQEDDTLQRTLKVRREA